jgi:hypothetical protein
MTKNFASDNLSPFTPIGKRARPTIANICCHLGRLTEGGRLSTVDLHIKVACFARKVKNVCNIKSSLSKLVCTRKAFVLRLPLQ